MSLPWKRPSTQTKTVLDGQKKLRWSPEVTSETIEPVCVTSFGEVLNLTRRAVPETRRLAGAKTVHNPTKENRVILLSPGLFCDVGTDIL